MNDNLIEIEELTKVFYTDEVETHALSGIHLTIARGEYVAMSGPSGCGSHAGSKSGLTLGAARSRAQPSSACS